MTIEILLKNIIFIISSISIFFFIFTTLKRIKNNNEPKFVWEFVLPFLITLILIIGLTIFEIFYKESELIVAGGYSIIYYYIFLHFLKHYKIKNIYINWGIVVFLIFGIILQQNVSNCICYTLIKFFSASMLFSLSGIFLKKNKSKNKINFFLLFLSVGSQEIYLLINNYINIPKFLNYYIFVPIISINFIIMSIRNLQNNVIIKME